MENKYYLELENISKSFNNVKANDNISLKVKKGEIHALLGENGAGKSTLMSILFGLYQADEGKIKINGEEVKINNPNDANDYGIGMVHQHFKLVEVFTVLENIILGVEPNKYGFLSFNEARKKITQLSNQYNLQVDLDAKITDITVGMQQRTEILKMLYRDNEILIFDEPTAVLTPQEIDELLQIMKNLANEGKAILFISHKLNEIMAVADTCTILRKGQLIATLDIKETTKEELSYLMVGRKINTSIHKENSKTGKTILKVENLKMLDKLHKNKFIVNGINFDVKEGEIVTIAGIDGNGQSETIYGITGLEKIHSGNVFIKDINVTKSSVFKRNSLKLSHIPEDRHKHGLVLDYTLANNMILQTYWSEPFSKYGFLRKKEINKYCDELINKYDIRSTNGSQSIARSMSGGNQQKAIVAREISRDPDLLVAVQLTRGLDVGAIEYIHNKVLEVRNQNKAVLLVSFELEEVIKLSDRILVMFEGEIVAEIYPNQYEDKNELLRELGLYMAGAKKNYQYKSESVSSETTLKKGDNHD